MVSDRVPEPRTSLKKYMENDGKICLWCGMNNLEGGSPEVDSALILLPVHCLDCNMQWYDEYRLTGYLVEEEQ